MVKPIRLGVGRNQLISGQICTLPAWDRAGRGSRRSRPEWYYHPMKIQIKYFAALREQAGCSEDGFETASTTPLALYRELSAIRGLTLDADTLKVAVNNSYASMEQPLEEGDAVVFIPPLAGG